ncbi:hypothetical protein Q0590_06165 [Rhodocytophaga aerolata]|uniref:Uncharacterized protein n=1 Tax=Rhodocytophaga aerolata TaxID=455078 RepID=A0ABT8R2G1_9BACT|nr:hypothetical protein [Rhodocytophaga aerolata]MDO1445826.1 hypothetical protein [Rhodocytophaga aerolata]
MIRFSLFNPIDAAAIVATGLIGSVTGFAPFINPQLTSYKIIDMLLYDLDETGHMHHVTKIDKPEVVRSIPVDLGELKVLNTLQQFGIFDYKFSVGDQAADEQLYFREYYKKRTL